jgi:hypothetical protein
MHTFSAIETQPKLPFLLNAKACAKSSLHENFAHAFTFGWFSDVFSVLSAQKLAMLVDLTSTF